MDANNFNNGYNNGYNGYPNGGYPGNGSPYNYGYQQPQKAPNILEQFALSFVPPQYGRLAIVKTGSMIGFVVLLTLIMTLITFVRFFVNYARVTNSKALDEWLPDFEIKNGQLSIDKDYLFDEQYVYIYITEDVEKFTYDDAEYLSDLKYTEILLAGRKNLVMLHDGKYQKASYKELGITFTLNKTWIMEKLLPMLWVGIAIGFLIYYVGRTLWYFLCAAVYFLIALIMGAAMNKKVSAGALFRTAVYSKVFMFVIVSLIGLIPLVSNFIPNILRIIVTIVFMGFAVAKLPDNC